MKCQKAVKMPIEHRTQGDALKLHVSANQLSKGQIYSGYYHI